LSLFVVSLPVRSFARFSKNIKERIGGAGSSEKLRRGFLKQEKH